MPEAAAAIVVSDSKPGNAPRLVFSAMDASVATEIEREFAQAGHVVVSNSRNHRMEPDVPLLVPEINPGHLSLIHAQQKNRGWKGMIVTNPNCSTIVLSLALAPLVQFGIERVIAATLQAVSGAGYPGVPSIDILANVIPLCRRRGREDGAGNAEDPGRYFKRSGRAAECACERTLPSRCRCRWTHGRDIG